MKMNEGDKTGSQADPERIDRWLYVHLEPSLEQVNRVVRRALAAERSVPGSKGFSWRTAAVAAACFSVIMLVVILVHLVHQRYRMPGPAEEGNTEIIATITNESGQVELQLHSVGKKQILPSEPSIRIFNQDGLVAAEITDGGIRYAVIGGEK